LTVGQSFLPLNRRTSGAAAVAAVPTVINYDRWYKSASDRKIRSSPFEVVKKSKPATLTNNNAARTMGTADEKTAPSTETERWNPWVGDGFGLARSGDQPSL
jgi:hypothetical protein